MDTQGPKIDEFIDQLIKDKHFKDITPEIESEIRNDLKNRLDKFILARIISNLSDEKVAQFNAMLDGKKSEAEIQEFVTNSIPDFVDFLTQTLMEFRGIYLGEIIPPVVFDQSGNPAAASKPPPAPVMPGEAAESTDLPPAPPAAVLNMQKTVN